MPTHDVSQIDPRLLMRVMDVTRELSAPLELDELLTRVIDAGREVLSAERGTVFLYDPRARELYATVATGEKEIRFSIDVGIAGEAARTRKIVNVPDCYADERFNPEIDRKTGYRTRCLITLPLIGLDDKLVGVLQLLNSSKNCFDWIDEQLAQVLGSQAAVAIQRARLVEERLVKLKLEADLQIAKQIQLSTLPKGIPPTPGYDVAARSQPADETGGDIFDLATVDADGVHDHAADDRLMLLIADATGHGIGPALSVAQVRAMFRLGIRLGTNLDILIEQINRQAVQDLRGGRFVTALLGELNTRNHEITYHSAGQGPILIYREATHACEFRDASTIPLGILDDIPFVDREIIAMQPGDMFVLLTDGFFEEINPGNEQVGRLRIAEEICRVHEHPAEDIMQTLYDFVSHFCHGAPQADDLTGIIIKRLHP